MDANLSATDDVAGENFGGSVSISTVLLPHTGIVGDWTIAVGAPNDKINGNTGQGSAFVFTTNSTSPTPSSDWIVPSDGVAGDTFGDSVAVGGNTVVVGAPNAAGGATSRLGTAYLYATGAAGMVTAGTATGTYGAGTHIAIDVVFDDLVTVTGTPQLTLNDGAVATYTGGSGEYALTFTYTVGRGQYTPDLDYLSTTSLKLNGGTITDNTSGMPATLTLPAPGSVDELAMANIVIATTPAPILLGKTVSPGPAMASYVQTIYWDIVPGATSYVLEMTDLLTGTPAKAYTIPSSSTKIFTLQGAWRRTTRFRSSPGIPTSITCARTSAPTRARRRRRTTSLSSGRRFPTR